MMKLTAIGALSLMASGLFAQGLNPGGQTKDSWEEINFEFNSSILSDGYPSLLRLADVLNQHKDYKLKVTGNTDIVGSAAYNEKLALARAESVKAFPGEIRSGGGADRNRRQRQARSGSRQQDQGRPLHESPRDAAR